MDAVIDCIVFNDPRIVGFEFPELSDLGSDRIGFGFV